MQSRHHLAILQELRANMQVMDDRVNKLSAKVNQMQSVNSADMQNTSVLTQNTTSCKVQSTVSPTRLAYNATTETESETLRDPECWANSNPTQTFRITLSKFPNQSQMMNKTAKLQPPARNYSQSHRRLRVS